MFHYVLFVHFRYLPSALLLVALCFAADEALADPAEIHISGPGSLLSYEAALTPGTEAMLDSRDLTLSPGASLDQTLRAVPGFQLFRRSESMTAHPTTQGVALRGVSASGASRALVLLDGVPLNDPFGGWVYWSRVPQSALSSVELTKGWGPLQWGSYGLSGSIILESLSPAEAGNRLSVDAGSYETFRLSALASAAEDAHGALAGADLFSTEGYHLLDEDQRGDIDIPASSRHKNVFFKTAFNARERISLGVSGGYFSEDRDNGTPFTQNDTEIAQLAFTLTRADDNAGGVQLTAFGQLQDFSSTFSSQAPDRSDETPALDQFDVPSTALGGSLVWASQSSERNVIKAGADLRWVEGETNEAFRFLDGEFQNRREAGGEQIVAGLFVLDSLQVNERLQLSAGMRGDLLRSSDLRRKETGIVDGEVLRDEHASANEELLLAPKLGAVYRLSERSELFGSVYRNERVPTLNELVRPFRVRNDITEANPDLEPERLTGAEAGIRVREERNAAEFVAFVGRIDDPIANVTRGTGPGSVDPCGFVPDSGVCRQRDNLGEAMIRGWELKLDYALSQSVLLSGAYLYTDSTIEEADSEDLEDKRLPQLPRHAATVAAEYAQERLAALLQLRFAGSQYEDDLNTLKLPHYTVLDATVHYRLTAQVELFLKGENLFDTEIVAGKTGDGLETLGPRQRIYAGARVLF